MAGRGGNGARRWRGLLVVGVVAVALLLQRGRIGELPAAWEALGSAEPGWVIVAVVASAASYVMAAYAMMGTVHAALPFRPTLLAQIAAGAATLGAPAGLGSAGLNVWYLERRGVARADAVTAAVLNGLAGGAVHALGLVFALVTLSHLVSLPTLRFAPNATTVVLLGVVLVASVGGSLVALRRVPHLVAGAFGAIRGGWATTRTLLTRVDRLLPLFGGSLGLTLAYGVTLWASAHALGLDLDLPTAIAIELTVAALAGLSPTPGGAGVAEAAGIQGLVLVGSDAATAIAVILVHRTVTTWLPALPGVLALRSLHRTATTVPPDDGDVPAPTQVIDLTRPERELVTV